jgi:small-conductance mechanosensitive channel
MRLAHKFADEPEEPKPGSATAALVAPLQLAGLRSLPGPLKQDPAESRSSDPETRRPANDPDQLDAAGDSLDRIRQTVASLRASDKRVRTMVEQLEAANQRAQIEIEAMQARLEAAELRIALEAARADAAEERGRQIEIRFGQILNGLADELERTG